MTAKYALGHRWSRLTLIDRQRSNDIQYYVMNCDCGNQVTVRQSNVLGGHTTSCGCYRKEVLATHEHYQRRSTLSTVWRYYRRNAKTRGIAWKLTKDEFEKLVLDDCHYCGLPAPSRILVKRNLVYNGIDRVDNTGPYSIENCVTACSICNFAKCQMSKDAFLQWAKRIAAHQGW